MKIRKLTSALLITCLMPFSSIFAADYEIDTKGSHAFIQFKIPHLGYSWLLGRFNDFSGTFSYEEKDPSSAKVEILINTASIDSNHAERDKHLRDEDFLHVSQYPEARFVSTAYSETEDGVGTLTGELTLRGVTRSITIDVKPVGEGPDPWGGYRRGYEGHTTLALKDYGFTYNLGPASKEVELGLYVEGIRQDNPSGRQKH